MSAEQSLLERGVERAVVDWEEELPLWRPSVPAARRARCRLCPPWLRLLWLGDVPHDAVHPLLHAVAEVVDDLTLGWLDCRYAGIDLREVLIEDGDIRMPLLDEPGVDLPDAVVAWCHGVVAELRTYREGLVRRACAQLARRRVTIDTAIALHVEPVVAAMVAQLLAELPEDR